MHESVADFYRMLWDNPGARVTAFHDGEGRWIIGIGDAVRNIGSVKVGYDLGGLNMDEMKKHLKDLFNSTLAQPITASAPTSAPWAGPFKRV